jgi:hypothetical protein
MLLNSIWDGLVYSLFMNALVMTSHSSIPLTIFFMSQMMRVDLTKFNKRFGIAKVSAKAYVGKDLCCEAELTLVLAK